MNEVRQPRIVALRYSPNPIEAYNTLVDGLAAGPGNTVFLQADPQAWNLAFLSHSYEKRAEHPDPQFTVLVRRSVDTELSTGIVDITRRLAAGQTVRSLLSLPAGDFIDAITRRQVPYGGGFVRLVDRLPLYLAYGDVWLATMRSRVALCLGDEVPNVDDAAALLKKF